MERYGDIVEILREVETSIGKLQVMYEKARKDDEIKAVLRPTVKSTLEHLRSVLEYSAQDIRDFCKAENSKLYFPYGKNESLFRDNAKKNLPNLHQDSKIYHIVESLQPHCCGDEWLSTLCDQTNFNKHNALGKQIRENSKSSTTDIGNFARVGGNAIVTIKNSSINGISIGCNGPVVVSRQRTTAEIQRDVGENIPVAREFDWVEFKFENTAKDTLSLIVKAHQEILTYIEKLRKELS
ncbi:hypothetical protein [Rheinheimera sp.]|uniref:hypothetical protein n=1 Tax=Rheinheimera TaxID=67575 RepID=UPI0023560AFC|nr:hypothetical protein [Rheinheimera sp.]